ncbi:hypothetical protein LIT25_07605 [Bacillus sp. F19]|nr:hypothetical protein LIT25_07605 [Bacillus sp. F19]
MYQYGFNPHQQCGCQHHGYQHHGYFPQQQQPGWSVYKDPYTSCTGVSCICDNGQTISKKCGPSGGTCDTKKCEITCKDSCPTSYQGYGYRRFR